MGTSECGHGNNNLDHLATELDTGRCLLLLEASTLQWNRLDHPGFSLALQSSTRCDSGIAAVGMIVSSSDIGMEEDDDSELSIG